MISFKQFDDNVQKFLNDIDRRLSRITNRLNARLMGKKGKIGLAAIDKLGRIPGPPVYPIRWKSERQRRAFFASKGFGSGIPTQRRNVIIKAWQVNVRPDALGGLIILSNPEPAWIYLQGDAAQPFHIDTGYVQLKDVQDEFLKEGEEIITEAWLTAGDIFKD